MIKDIKKVCEHDARPDRKLDAESIAWCEDKYPAMTAEYKRISDSQYATFCKKHRNYGCGNINVGTNLETEGDVKLALTGLWFRMNDKVQRLKQLVVIGEPDMVGEAIEDTYQDLSVYGIIAQLVQQKRFK
jgi:hypothetical protein